MFLTKEKFMSKKKDPPGYPGDEAFKKKLGEVLGELRVQKGLSIDEMNAFIDACTEEDVHPLLPRALALVARQLRESKKMSRVELSEASGVPLALINKIERAKAHNATVTQVARIAVALGHSAGEFLDQVFELADRLGSS